MVESAAARALKYMFASLCRVERSGSVGFFLKTKEKYLFSPRQEFAGAISQNGVMTLSREK